MSPDQLRLEVERTLREPAPDVELAAWLLSMAPAESLEAVELRRVLSLELRRRGQS
ncbi:MAG: hypothetical protein R3B89_17045 [Polyangiaceae bacterium]